MITLDVLRNLKDESIELQFEMLADFAFNCDRGDDPWNTTKDSILEHGIPSESLKRNINRILIKLILDNKTNSKVNKFLELEERLWDASSQEISVIVEETIETLTDDSLNKSI